MLTVMEDGHTIGSAIVGREGTSWVSASLGSPTMPCQTMVALGGTARKIKANVGRVQCTASAGGAMPALDAYSTRPDPESTLPDHAGVPEFPAGM